MHKLENALRCMQSQYKSGSFKYQKKERRKRSTYLRFSFLFEDFLLLIKSSNQIGTFLKMHTKTHAHAHTSCVCVWWSSCEVGFLMNSNHIFPSLTFLLLVILFAIELQKLVIFLSDRKFINMWLEHGDGHSTAVNIVMILVAFSCERKKNAGARANSYTHIIRNDKS